MTHPIHAAAKPYLTGWRYGRTPRVAYEWPKGVRGPALADTIDGREIDCSTLTASLLMRLYPDAGWTQGDYAGLQVFDAKFPSSPVVTVQARRVGEMAAVFTPERLHLAQGWRRLPGHKDGASGHAVLVWDRGNLLLDVLESTSREGNKGPRWRVTTADKLREEFPAALYIARLNP
jgi:hypothetical protein